ncbi:MAG: DUF349 domain-containing protein [Betaproteobacteria bacterium]|nr:DUF349 domain-containing protein [Betaproteobacteria bacterium]
MFSRLLSSQIHWDKASSEQKLDALGDLPPNDPQLEKLALNDGDERVRRKAFERMEAEAQLRLVGVVQAGDEAYLATCIGGNFDDQVLSSGDVVAQLISAPSTFRVALIGHAKSEPLAIALTETLDNDADRAQVVHGKGAIGARAAATKAMRDVELLEQIATEFRDKQRRLYRAARDRADALLAAREIQRHATELCERIENLLARHELTLTAYTNTEREWQALIPTSAQDMIVFAALQARHATSQEKARAILQEQGEIWREAERMKVALAELLARSDSAEAVEPENMTALIAERESAEAKLSLAAFAAVPKERNQLNEACARLAERHAVLATESRSLATARKLIADLRADPAAMTPGWRSEFARAVAIVRPALRAPLEEAATEARATIDSATRAQNEARRAVEQQFRGEIETLVKELEQLLDKGQHHEANEIEKSLKDKRAQASDARSLPVALEFRLKRGHERLAKMNEWKRFGDVQARESLCREAEALARRVAKPPRIPALPDFPWPVGGATPIVELPPFPWPVGDTAPAVPQDIDETSLDAGAPRSPESGAAPLHKADTSADAPPPSPEELAMAVRDLQDRWHKLDKGHSTSSKGLWERFRRACDRAYAPARKHFEELEKQRSENAAKKNALLDKIAALNERIVDNAEWGRIISERGELVKAWFEAGALPRKDARGMQKRFDTLTGEIESKIDARRNDERARRRELIDKSKLIAEKPADGASMSAMIALQKQWQEGMKGAIRLKAREDQTLWEEFRAAGSALFGKRDAEKAARLAERDAQFADRQKLVEEMQTLTASDDAQGIKRGVDEIGARWHGLAWPDRKPLRDWEQKFSNARAAASARISAIRAEIESRLRAAAASRLAVVERAEQSLANGDTPDIEAMRGEIQAMLPEGEKLDSRLLARLSALAAAAKRGPEAWRAESQKMQAERDALLLELEIVLALPSPPALETERRMRMLKRLAESKNARSTPPLMAPDAPKAVEKLLAMPLAMQGVQARVEAVIEAARRKSK